MKFEEWEINKYWEIFRGLDPVDGLLSGNKVAVVLRNSRLPQTELSKVWELSDVNKDGQLDFEEFCIAMRLIFDRINSVMDRVPDSLPDWLVPASKAHLVTANNALEEQELSSEFDWYISPTQRQQYASVYSEYADTHGHIFFDALRPFYATLSGVPETDISSAWNLVNPRSDEKIDKEPCLVFLHMLYNRSRGARIPHGVPATLRATFEKSKPLYDVSAPLPVSTSTQASAASAVPVSPEKTLTDELAQLEQQIAEAHAAKRRLSHANAVQQELEGLLDYKQSQLQFLKAGNFKSRPANAAAQEVELIETQIQSLRNHKSQRQRELNSLRESV